jgi:hypothetical protein
MRGTMRTAISGEGVFMPAVVTGLTNVASSIPRFISMEVVEALGPALRQRSRIAVMRIKAIVYMSVKAVTAMKPGTGSEKHPADKPIGTVISIGSTVIRFVVEVSIRTHGSRSDVYADSDLGRGHGYGP